ncbi:hypothetical protein EJB05_13360, partial [Eragrostis curvula]
MHFLITTKTTYDSKISTHLRVKGRAEVSPSVLHIFPTYCSSKQIPLTRPPRRRRRRRLSVSRGGAAAVGPRCKCRSTSSAAPWTEGRAPTDGPYGQESCGRAALAAAKFFAFLLRRPPPASAERGTCARGSSRQSQVGYIVGAAVLERLVQSSCLPQCTDGARVLDEMPKRNAPAWTAAISSCTRAGRYADSMRTFTEMLADGAVRGSATLDSGKRVHGWMLRNVVRPDAVLGNAVLDMYAKCGDHQRAKRAFGAMAERNAVSWNVMISACLQHGDVLGATQLFDESPLRDIASWNTIISGLMRNGCATEALDHLHQMARAGVVFNQYTYSTAFALAGMLSLPDLGRQLHGRIVTAALQDDSFVWCSLMDMYCKCGGMEVALLIFDPCSRFTSDVKFA